MTTLEVKEQLAIACKTLHEARDRDGVIFAEDFGKLKCIHSYSLPGGVSLHTTLLDALYLAIDLIVPLEVLDELVRRCEDEYKHAWSERSEPSSDPSAEEFADGNAE